MYTRHFCMLKLKGYKLRWTLLNKLILLKLSWNASQLVVVRLKAAWYVQSIGITTESRLHEFDDNKFDVIQLKVITLNFNKFF